MSEVFDKIKEINDRWASQEPSHDQFPAHKGGSIHQRDRLREVAELALQTYDGDILEIGCHIGLTTRIFAELAKKYDRKVVVIDPWDGRQEGNQTVSNLSSLSVYQLGSVAQHLGLIVTLSYFYRKTIVHCRTWRNRIRGNIILQEDDFNKYFNTAGARI